MLLPLTDSQSKVFDALHGFFSEYGYPPTITELSQAVGKKNVGGELIALRKKGWAAKMSGIGKRSTIPSDEALKRIDDAKQTNLNF